MGIGGGFSETACGMTNGIKTRWQELKKIDWQSMFRYGVVGVGNTLTDFLVFSLLVFRFEIDSLIANGIAFAVAVTQGYWLNAHWTFRDTAKGKFWSKYLSFVAVNLGGLVVSMVMLLLLRQVIGPLAGKLSSVLFVFAWGYGMSRRLIFRPNSNQLTSDEAIV